MQLAVNEKKELDVETQAQGENHDKQEDMNKN